LCVQEFGFRTRGGVRAIWIRVWITNLYFSKATFEGFAAFLLINCPLIFSLSNNSRVLLHNSGLTAASQTDLELLRFSLQEKTNIVQEKAINI
jgi:hypothetical protein